MILTQTKDADVVAFDEVQFFSSAIMELVSELAYCGKHVIVDGLNMDYRGKEFGYVGGLLAMADDIEKLSAFCARLTSHAAAAASSLLTKLNAELIQLTMIRL
ncbi:hypothetical protein G195_001282 [Phytophthora kernoviae 00238/432]|uniref:Thymidine kinase n=1 Tax=Phytophthora kernoviae 00238/432 TaxID=1284355 RepID=A0A8J4SU66_9STRA|nr:hypothetical protein G195_001282 [Phytophthora kernoviae 00238/432]